MHALILGLGRHRLSVAALTLLAVLDIATTALGLSSAPGFVLEQNPFGAAAWSIAGPVGLVGYKAFFLLPLAGTLVLDGRDPDDRYLHRLVGTALFAGTLFSSLIVAGNLAILARLSGSLLP